MPSAEESHWRGQAYKPIPFCTHAPVVENVLIHLTLSLFHLRAPTKNPLSKTFTLNILIQIQNQLGLLRIFIHATEHEWMLIDQLSQAVPVWKHLRSSVSFYRIPLNGHLSVFTSHKLFQSKDQLEKSCYTLRKMSYLCCRMCQQDCEEQAVSAGLIDRLMDVKTIKNNVDIAV